MIWAIENPKAGIVETDEMDFRRCLEVQRHISARWSASIPTGRRSPTASRCSRKTLDRRDPWQFANILVR